MGQADQDKPNVTSESAEAGGNEGATYEWTVHPVRRRPLVSVLVTLFIAAVGATVQQTMESQFFTLLAMIILLASLAKFYFPTHFKLSRRGVTIKTTTQTLFKEWKIYRSCYPDKKGLLLSPFLEPTRLENFRGLYLMFEGNADEVTTFAREQIKRAHRSTETNAEAAPSEEEPNL